MDVPRGQLGGHYHQGGEGRPRGGEGREGGGGGEGWVGEERRGKRGREKGGGKRCE